MRKGFRPQSRHSEEVAAEKLVKLFQKNDWASLENEASAFIAKYQHLVFGHKALAVALTQQGRLLEALDVMDKVLAKFPHDTELLNNHAATLIKLGNLESAIIAADRIIKADPTNNVAFANKGIALKCLGAWSRALECYHRAIELNPADSNSLSNAGIALLEMEKPSEAIICLEAALQLNPRDTETKLHLGLARITLQQFSDAKSELLSLLAAHPGNSAARSHMIQALRSECLFAEAGTHAELLLNQIREERTEGPLVPFHILCLEQSSLSDQKKTTYQHALADLQEFLNTPPLISTTHRGRLNKPLRIGYLSADIHHHATLLLMIGVLEKHKSNNVDVYLYSSGPDDESPLRKRAEAACSVFRNIHPLSYLEAARQIATDEVDILVDLKGYTKDARLQICALRPAPVIVSWLGYPGTLGHPRLADYIIGDPITTPLEHQAFYSETLALMPHCYQPNDQARQIGPIPTRSSLGLPNDALVFCSFNQPHKLTEPVFKQWCRLLTTVPNSILWILMEKAEAQRNLLLTASQYGVGPDRFVFAPNINITEHLGRLQQADIALDSTPYGSHTTGSDALWAGVPLIAIKGQTFASRVSSSLLLNVGLPELITENPEAACDLAIALANDKYRLEELKKKLKSNRNQYPLFDTDRFTIDLERMYRTIWSRHLAGIREPIVLPPASH